MITMTADGEQLFEAKRAAVRFYTLQSLLTPEGLQILIKLGETAGQRGVEDGGALGQLVGASPLFSSLLRMKPAASR